MAGLPTDRKFNYALGSRSAFSGIFFFGKNPTYEAIEKELQLAAPKMTEKAPIFTTERLNQTQVWLGTREELAQVFGLQDQVTIRNLGEDGYWMGPIDFQGKTYFTIVGNRPVGVLYGVFDWLKSLQSGSFDLNKVKMESPKIQLRMLNHWDNLDRTVERGYAGFSIWDWHRLPGYIDPRYIDYARANASIGINAVSLTNVNANARILTTDFMKKAKVLADIFRPYGIKVFLTARFSAPIEIGGLKTADPLDQEVIAFWKRRPTKCISTFPTLGDTSSRQIPKDSPGRMNTSERMPKVPTCLPMLWPRMAEC